MKVLCSYKEVPEQLINKSKSYFIIPSYAFKSTANRVKAVIGFVQTSDPFTYLGYPIYIGRQRVIYFSDLVSKVVVRVAGWQTKVLSFGSVANLINYVLQSLPIHLLSSISPPTTTMNQIQGLFADFFWD